MGTIIVNLDEPRLLQIGIQCYILHTGYAGLVSSLWNSITLDIQIYIIVTIIYNI